MKIYGRTLMSITIKTENVNLDLHSNTKPLQKLKYYIFKNGAIQQSGLLRWEPTFYWVN